VRRPLLLLAALLGVGYLALAWFELVPGGWRLRNLVEPWPERRARREREYREERLAAFRAEASPTAPVVFLGSSTIERFPLAELFPGAATLNRGVAFEPSSLLLERLAIGVPEDAAGFVVYAASIDHRFEGRGPSEVAAALRRVVAGLRERHPRAPVAVLGLLSERGLDGAERARLEAANGALRAACEVEGATFVSTDRAPLTGPDGTLALALSTDELHLSREGYRVVAGWLLAEGGEVGELLAVETAED
jgi:hypothetical protein